MHEVSGEAGKEVFEGIPSKLSLLWTTSVGFTQELVRNAESPPATSDLLNLQVVWGPSLPSPSHSPTIRFKEDPLECPTISPPMSAAKLAGLRRHGGRVNLDSLVLNFPSPLEG